MKRLKDFSRKKIREIATEYATTNLAYNHSYFEKEYEISEATFYNILQKSIVESIVNDEIAKCIGKKAQANSEQKAGKYAGIQTKRHQEHLLMKRKTFKFSKSYATKIAIMYSKSNLDKKSFCHANVIHSRLFDDALVRAVVERWIDDKAYERIKSKAFKNHGSSSNAYELFQKLDKLRNNHNQEQR